MVDSRSFTRAIWIDMIKPTKEEESAIESALGIEVPTPQEMREVESSSQIYREGQATFMTIRIMDITAGLSLRLTAATFILTPDHLVTLRYENPSPFRVFSKRWVAQSDLLDDPKSTPDRSHRNVCGPGRRYPRGVGD
jgi:magnesium transporter